MLSGLKIVKELGRKEILLSITRDPATGRAYWGASDGKVYAADPLAEKPEFQELEGHASYVTGVAWTGSTLVSGSYDGRLIWWDLAAGKPGRTVEAHSKWIRRVTATIDGKLVASVADDMVCRVWDAGSGQLVHELRGHEAQTPHHFPSMLYAAAFSADGARLATIDKVGHLVVWDVASGKQLKTLETPGMYTWDPKQRIHSIGGPRSLAFSPDGKQLAVGGMGQVGNIDHLEGKSRVELFDLEKGERLLELQNDQFKGLVEKLIFMPDGKELLAAGGDNGGFLQAIDIAEKKISKQEKSPTHVHDAIINESCDRVFAASHGKLVVWELQKA